MDANQNAMGKIYDLPDITYIILLSGCDIIQHPIILWHYVTHMETTMVRSVPLKETRNLQGIHKY